MSKQPEQKWYTKKRFYIPLSILLGIIGFSPIFREQRLIESSILIKNTATLPLVKLRESRCVFSVSAILLPDSKNHYHSK